ncbi:MAG: lipoyl synthase [marine bacterium B5-7]|nr:MAG: lipoyl synthase [marine bacterium B5-7]
MTDTTARVARPRVVPGQKLRGEEKLARIPIKVEKPKVKLKKPPWMKIKLPSESESSRVKALLRGAKLHTVCEEAACPNLPECFGKGTATFMILGDVCTRRCPFCEVAHGRPLPPDSDEPDNLARTIRAMGLRYVVITSVDRDDLKDGGACHFADCITAVRRDNPDIRVEILVPDFRGRMDVALDILGEAVPEVFNHNLETVPRLYKQARPGSDYAWSLRLIKEFKQRHRDTRSKSGLMVGLGETNAEIVEVMKDLRNHDCDMLTIGQYLQPSEHHLAVERYVTPDEFADFRRIGKELGFVHVASGPFVRSSYHADLQADGVDV